MTAPLLLTLERAAEVLSVSPRTVRRLLDAGELTPIRVRQALRVSAAEVNAYVVPDRKLQI